MSSLVEKAVNDVTGHFGRIVLAGIVGVFAWDITNDVLSRLLFSTRPEPAPLVMALLGLPGGPGGYRWLAELIHYATGVIAYPLGYVLVVRQILPLPWIVKGALWGAALWVFALGIMAPLAGNPFMLNWGNITWASGLGHVMLGIGIAFTFERGFART